MADTIPYMSPSRRAMSRATWIAFYCGIAATLLLCWNRVYVHRVVDPAQRTVMGHGLRGIMSPTPSPYQIARDRYYFHKNIAVGLFWGAISCGVAGLTAAIFSLIKRDRLALTLTAVGLSLLPLIFLLYLLAR